MQLRTEFRPDREIYMRDHAVMAAIGMGAAMLLLWVMDNPHVWTGAVAGLGAIAVRGWYMASEELARVWVLEDGHLRLGDMSLPLGQIETARPILSAVQVITRSGDKHLIKYQPDPAAIARTITEALP
ncbi:hypothetical protein PGB28_16135 [Primorskyibacter aestuariivivens]|nr:hypothetical protein [Primorskyibacter aestuariivivens]MDA7429995.1 hypothetical protein [Primorskyibacter aestuariivivens]